MLTDEEIADMRTAANLALPETGTVKRPSRASDGAGGERTTLNTVVASVACRLEPPGFATRAVVEIYSARIGGRQTTVVVFPAGTDVEVDDQAVIGGESWHVLSVLSGSWELTRNVLAVRL